MSWRTGLTHLLHLGGDDEERPRLWGEPGTPEFEQQMRRRAQAYTPEEDPQDGKVPGTAGHDLAAARELLERHRAFAPHCDQRILHEPGACWACDLYPDWQALRKKWGICFTGQSPMTGGLAWKELPCPADFNRPPDSKSDHRQWGPNQAQGERP